MENLARDRAKELFGAEHANVQPHSGTQANMAVYASVLKPGDTVLGMALDQGGHLSHGSPVSFSGKIYHFEPYFVDEATGVLDMDAVRRRAIEVQAEDDRRGLQLVSAHPRFRGVRGDRHGRSRPISWWTWPTLPGSSPAARIPARSRTPIS